MPRSPCRRFPWARERELGCGREAYAGALRLTDLLLLIALVLALVACGGLAVMLAALQWVISRAPRLGPPDLAASCATMPDTSLSVVVPAYNEADNIAELVRTLLASNPPCRSWSLLLVDDDSSDDTAALALEAAAGDPRVQLLAAGPRPGGEHWVGKNWACDVGWRHLQEQPSPPDWLLFIDADLRPAADALPRALAEAINSGADLLSLAPQLCCGCLAEWLVQPIIAGLLGLGFPIERANDPDDPLAFAAGPFMLFHSSAYAAVGGHRAVAGEVVEDLALARLIKGRGLRLRYLLATDCLSLRMYRNFAALWEGWSKNWLLGLDRDVVRALAAAALVVELFTVPWLLAPLGLAAWLLLGAPWLLLACLGAIGLQLALRLWIRQHFGLPLTHWWLAGLGGLIIGALAPVSVWRTLTGRGWTWRGRSLAAAPQSPERAQS